MRPESRLVVVAKARRHPTRRSFVDPCQYRRQGSGRSFLMPNSRLPRWSRRWTSEIRRHDIADLGELRSHSWGNRERLPDGRVAVPLFRCSLSVVAMFEDSPGKHRCASRERRFSHGISGNCLSWDSGRSSAPRRSTALAHEHRCLLCGAPSVFCGVSHALPTRRGRGLGRQLQLSQQARLSQSRDRQHRGSHEAAHGEAVRDDVRKPTKARKRTTLSEVGLYSRALNIIFSSASMQPA